MKQLHKDFILKIRKMKQGKNLLGWCFADRESIEWVCDSIEVLMEQMEVDRKMKVTDYLNIYSKGYNDHKAEMQVEVGNDYLDIKDDFAEKYPVTDMIYDNIIDMSDQLFAKGFDPTKQDLDIGVEKKKAGWKVVGRTRMKT